MRMRNFQELGIFQCFFLFLNKNTVFLDIEDVIFFLEISLKDILYILWAKDDLFHFI